MKRLVFWLEKIDKLIQWLIKINRWFYGMAMFALFAMMTIDTLNIVGVKLGLLVIPAGETFIEEFLTVVAFAGLGFLSFERGHIRTQILVNRLPEHARSACNILYYLMLISVGSFIFWMNGVTASEAIRLKIVRTAYIMIPTGPFFALIALSFLNLAIGGGVLLVKEILTSLLSNRKGIKE